MATAAAVVEQRLAAVVSARVESLDLADEDRVIAARVGVDDRAFELGQRLVDDGQAELASMVRDALELLDTGEARGGEAAGQGLLVRGEHIDREPAA